MGGLEHPKLSLLLALCARIVLLGNGGASWIHILLSLQTGRETFSVYFRKRKNPRQKLVWREATSACLGQSGSSAAGTKNNPLLPH